MLPISAFVEDAFEIQVAFQLQVVFQSQVVFQFHRSQAQESYPSATILA